MIHDMKSPLQSVMMGAHILASGKLADKPGKLVRYRQVMGDECEHLLTLSNRVVMLTEIDRGELLPGGGPEGENEARRQQDE